MSNEETAARLAQQAEQIQNQIDTAQKLGVESAKDLLALLKKIKDDADECVLNKKSINNANVDALQRSLRDAQKNESDKLNERIGRAETESADRNKKIAQLEEKLAQCESSKENITVPGPQQLEQIRKLEQQRLASAAEAVVLRKERDALEEKLQKFITTVDRIAQLRKKCAAQGKSLADEIGEATALKINDLESQQKSNIALQQKKVDDAHEKLQKIEVRLAESYEEECVLRDEQQKTAERVDALDTEKAQLQSQWQEEQSKLATTLSELNNCQTLQKQISASLGDAQTELASLKEQFAKLYESDLVVKQSEQQLKQQFNELQQENNALLKNKKQLEDTLVQKSNETNAQTSLQDLSKEEREQLINDNTVLREKARVQANQINTLQISESSLKADVQSYVEQIRALDEEVKKLKEQNLADFKRNEELLEENAKLKADLQASIDDAAQAGVLGKTLLDKVIQMQKQQ